MTPRARQRRTRRRIRNAASLLSLVAFLALLGSVGAVEQDLVPLLPGAIRIPSAELVPIWRDAERTKLDGFIRFYDQVIYIGTRKHTITHAELWWTGGVKYFKTDAFAGTIAGDFIVDTEHGDETNDYTEPHFTVGNKCLHRQARRPDREADRRRLQAEDRRPGEHRLLDPLHD